MNELICPSCEGSIMDITKAETLLRTTATKVLIGHCFCGVAYEIRSPNRNVFDVLTSSGKRSEQFIEEGEER